MTMATAGADGDPWVSPVYFAAGDRDGLLWVSEPGTRHSLNIAARPRIAVVIFDSRVAIGEAQALYGSGEAAEVAGEQLETAIAAPRSGLRSAGRLHDAVEGDERLRTAGSLIGFSFAVTFACIDRRRRGHSSPSDPGRIEIDEKVNLAQKFELLEAPYEPGIVGYLNDLKLQIVKVDGPFVWHKHDETDDFFLVVKGRLTIHLRDRDVELSEGELFVVPRGVEHCPEATEEAHVLLIEPRGTVNTGDAGGELTAEPREL